jgi:hypothetical protein
MCADLGSSRRSPTAAPDLSHVCPALHGSASHPGGRRATDCAHPLSCFCRARRIIRRSWVIRAVPAAAISSAPATTARISSWSPTRAGEGRGRRSDGRGPAAATGRAYD